MQSGANNPNLKRQREVANPPPAIPTLSEWGVVAMTLLLLTAGTIVFARRKRPSLG